MKVCTGNVADFIAPVPLVSSLHHNGNCRMLSMPMFERRRRRSFSRNAGWRWESGNPLEVRELRDSAVRHGGDRGHRRNWPAIHHKIRMGTPTSAPHSGDDRDAGTELFSSRGGFCRAHYALAAGQIAIAGSGRLIMSNGCEAKRRGVRAAGCAAPSIPVLASPPRACSSRGQSVRRSEADLVGIERRL